MSHFLQQDGNGLINRQELRIVMMNLGEKLNEEEIECLIDDVDIDGDGLISFEDLKNVADELGEDMTDEEILAEVETLMAEQAN